LIFQARDFQPGKDFGTNASIDAQLATRSLRRAAWLSAAAGRRGWKNAPFPIRKLVGPGKIDSRRKQAHATRRFQQIFGRMLRQPA